MLGSVLSVVFPIVALIIVFLAAIWCWVRWRYREIIRVAATVPCVVPPWPIVGHFPYITFPKWLLKRTIIDTSAVVDMSLKAVSEGKHTVCFWGGPIPVLMFHDLSDIEKILNSSSTLEKADEYNLIERFAGKGLLTGPVSVWKHTRRHLSPLFRPQNMEAMVPTFNSNSRQLVSLLGGSQGDGPVDVYEHAMIIALKTVCQLIYGATAELDVASPAFRDLKDAFEKIPAMLIRRFMYPWLRWDWLYNCLYKKEIYDIDCKIKGFTLDAVKNIKEEKHQGDLSHEEILNYDNQASNKRYINLLEAFEELRMKFPQLNDSYFKEEINTFIGAGSDTLSVAVSSCLLLLAKYQDIQERLCLEILEVVGPDNDVSMQDLRKMPYLNQVYKETLRWASVVPFIGRKTSAEVKLKSCTVPVGNILVISIAGVHMDAKRYPDPEKFNPENFSPDNENFRGKYSLLPFSAGPRNCVGQLYAEIFFKCMVIHVLRAYKLSTDMDVEHLVRKLSMVFISVKGYKVLLTPRPRLSKPRS